MILANHEDGTRHKATPGTVGYCPQCNSELIPKCGVIKIWHWSHKAKDISCNYKPETEWHLFWKELALVYGCDIEVPMGENRADIVSGNRVIELQNSPISTTDIISRCENYNAMGYTIDWVFNMEKKFMSDQLRFNKPTPYKSNGDRRQSFRQQWPKTHHLSLISGTVPKYGMLMYDIGPKICLFNVKALTSESDGWGNFVERTSILR